jgi:septal ring factor EnvC (AmiA/AmiB activator)
MEGNGTQRELGQFFQEVKELRHDHSNLRIVLNALDENQRSLERELMHLRSELKTFQAKIMATGSGSLAILTAGAWALQIYLQK